MSAHGRGGTDSSSPVGNPIFFQRNRVFRVYRGGRLFHEFFGDPAEDGFHPEEWVASTVRALNKEPSSEHEGISLVAGTGRPFTELMERHREALVGKRPGFEVLVKLLDSAIRLPVQAHPDKAFARRHFGSPHGKTEMWLVLATREDACLYFGFKEGVSRQDLVEASQASETDREALPSLLNRLPAAPGDVYLIPARVAHAIGPGCLILEVQEPTDFTIQPEAWCGDYRLSPYEMYLGLEEETALQCFDFAELVGERAVSAGGKRPRSILDTPAVSTEHLVTFQDTPDFAVNRYRLRGGSHRLGAGPAVYVVTDGAGRIESGTCESGTLESGTVESGTPETGTFSRAVRKGDYFFLPACLESLTLSSAGHLEVVECLPPQSAAAR